MKWLEMIQVRICDGNRRPLETELNKLIDEIRGRGAEQMVVIYNRPLIDTDYCIQIVHDSTVLQNPGSPLGLQLAVALKEFGLVSHTIWGEVKRK